MPSAYLVFRGAGCGQAVEASLAGWACSSPVPSSMAVPLIALIRGLNRRFHRKEFRLRWRKLSRCRSLYETRPPCSLRARSSFSRCSRCSRSSCSRSSRSRSIRSRSVLELLLCQPSVLLFLRERFPVCRVLIPLLHAIPIPVAPLDFAVHGVVEAGVLLWPVRGVVVVLHQGMT